MPPPPRPPIICYDISSNGTVCRRRIEPISSIRSRKPITPTVTYKSYVPPTIISNSPRTKRYSNTLASSVTSSHQRQSTSPYKLSTTNTTRTSYPASSFAVPQRKTELEHINSTAPTSQYSNNYCRSYPINESNNATSGCNKNEDLNNNNGLLYNKYNNVNARQAYGQKLRAEAEQREKQRHHELHHRAMIDKLEQIQAQLNELQKHHNILSNTYGMGHNAAKYIQRQDEEYAKLRQKVDQFAETRAKEITRQTQRARQYHELLQDKDRRNDERLKDISNLHHPRCHQKRELHLSPVKGRNLNNSLSSTSSPTTITPSNSQGSSSTISLSTCPSPMSTTDEQLAPPAPLTPQHHSSINHKSLNNNNSHLVKSSHHVSFSTPPSQLSKYQMYQSHHRDPYPNDTLEVTDMEFFAKVEDQTMIEANNLMNRLQSTLKDFKDI